jgi:hypothetical protein
MPTCEELPTTTKCPNLNSTDSSNDCCTNDTKTDPFSCSTNSSSSCYLSYKDYKEKYNDKKKQEKCDEENKKSLDIGAPLKKIKDTIFGRRKRKNCLINMENKNCSFSITMIPAFFVSFVYVMVCLFKTMIYSLLGWDSSFNIMRIPKKKMICTTSESSDESSDDDSDDEKCEEKCEEKNDPNIIISEKHDHNKTCEISQCNSSKGSSDIISCDEHNNKHQMHCIKLRDKNEDWKKLYTEYCKDDSSRPHNNLCDYSSCKMMSSGKGKCFDLASSTDSSEIHINKSYFKD